MLKESDCIRTSLIRKLVTWIANYLNRLGPLGKFVKNSTKLSCLEITGCGSSTIQCYGFLNLKSGTVNRFRRGYIL
jgi:hypothetical protein